MYLSQIGSDLRKGERNLLLGNCARASGRWVAAKRAVSWRTGRHCGLQAAGHGPSRHPPAPLVFPTPPSPSMPSPSMLSRRRSVRHGLARQQALRCQMPVAAGRGGGRSQLVVAEPVEAEPVEAEPAVAGRGGGRSRLVEAEASRGWSLSTPVQLMLGRRRGSGTPTRCRRRWSVASGASGGSLPPRFRRGQPPRRRRASWLIG